MEKERSLRWLTLLAILLNILFNILYEYLPNARPVHEIMAEYPAFFTPAGYAFSVWLVIYASFVIYGVIQLLPSARHKHLYDAINPLLLCVNILGIIWIVAFATNYIIASMLVIMAMLVCAMIIFRIVKAAHLSRHYPFLIVIPFSLLAGWLTIANIANFTILLSYGGYLYDRELETYFTIILIIISALVGIAVSLKYMDWIYPLVIAWSLFVVWVVNKPVNGNVAVTAMGTGLVLLLWSLGYLAYTLRKPAEEAVEAITED